MEILKKRIVLEGKVIGGDTLKVDMFLNHQIDVGLLEEIGKEFYTRFADENINKILTVEASGIGIACIAAQQFSVPVVFAKKGVHRNVGNDIFTSDVYSFTKGENTVIGMSREYICSDDRVLIIDDFLANGGAVNGLISIIEQAGATLCGVGIVIEKGFQRGGTSLREKGVPIESLAIIKSMKDGKIEFV
ncbi:MAG TPA: xanthine phosphoribosyltransferase [Clostridia bacterium]|nr:xanthine phosphoribosyltransferase [Clostridia bacterium]